MKVESYLYSNYSDSFRNKKLEQYKNDYLDLVDYYKKLNEDNDEIYFVDSEIRLINEYIRPVVESQKTELEQRGILDLTNHMIKISLSSYLKIISFLQSRKLELEKESSSPSQQLEPEILDLKYFPKPCFKTEFIESITDILNIYFDKNQHAELKRIIETGSNTREKLLFRDNGNKLTDYFRELFNKKIITGCTKTILIAWIIDNFKYFYRDCAKDFNPKTVEKTISNINRLCKNPII
jgi:hypothetical protein